MNESLQLFQRAQSCPERIAFIENERQVTYAELLARSAGIAAALLRGDADLNEARIAFAAPGGSDYAAIQWGIWRAGGVAVPLNIHATLPEIQHCTRTASIETLITLPASQEKFAALCEEDGISMIALADIDMQSRVELPQLNLSRRAMIIFTSGTTSKPKGVVTTHGNIQAQVSTLVDFWQWRSADVIPLFLPMHHVHGIINVMTCALWSGATVDAYAGGFDLQRICEQVTAGAYSVFMAVPTIYVKLLQAMAEMEASELQALCHGFSNLRLMISGSAALPVKIHQQWQSLTGQILLERYGMTEIGMALSNPYHGERRPGAVGAALPGVQVRLMSEDGDLISAEDMPGEIWVKGDNVFAEYWQNPAATAQSFTDGWFRTGDMATLENGYYRIMGRLSVDIIKSGGYKLSALEIENYLLDHPAIAECAVVGVADETWGEGVAAAVVLHSGAKLSLEALSAWAREKMSNYKIPRSLIIADSLPRNAMGKIIKPEVLKLFQ